MRACQSRRGNCIVEIWLGYPLFFRKNREIATYTNPQGGETKYFYTTDGKLHRRQNPDGTLQQWRYRLDGRLSKEILSDGSYWETAYNDRERNISRVRKDSSHKTLSQESYTFDRRGNVTSYADGKNGTITRQYDGLNRLKTEFGPSAQEWNHISYGRNTLLIINNLEEKQIFTKDAWGRITKIVNEDANNQKVAETTYAYSPNNITETNGTVSTTTTFDPLGNPVLVNRFDSDEGFAKQVLDIGVAHVSTIGIPVSMYLGFAGQAAEWWGLTNVASKLNTASGSILEFVADRWTAGNQGPMGRVVDKQIYATTSLLRPAIGMHNQQLLAGWLTGNSPNDIVYAQNSVQVRDMQMSLNVGRFRIDAHAKRFPEGYEFGHDTIPAYRETIFNRATANWKSTAMQVGGYGGATIKDNHDGTVTFTIKNTAGANSFFLHVVPNLRRSSGPMSNVRQIFKWPEPKNPSLLPENQ